MGNPDYLPLNVEFSVANNNSQIPETLGMFESQEEANKFIHLNTVALNTNISAVRFMDNTEKRNLREEYIELLEVKLPLQEKDLLKAMQNFENAKKALADAKEYVSATTNEIKAIAQDVKRGTCEMQLNEECTYRVPCNDLYYYYTFVSNQLKLCKIQEIPAFERGEMFNTQTKNEEFLIRKIVNEEQSHNLLMQAGEKILKKLDELDEQTATQER
jgi:hypothetical protein